MNNIKGLDVVYPTPVQGVIKWPTSPTKALGNICSSTAERCLRTAILFTSLFSCYFDLCSKQQFSHILIQLKSSESSQAITRSQTPPS